MTRLTSIFLIIIFLLSLVVGITIGSTVKNARQNPTPTTVKSPDYVTLGSVLVLGVNDFSAEEIVLESAWQVTVTSTYRQGIQNLDVVLVSYYPLAPTQGAAPNERQYLSPHTPITFPKAYLNDLDAFGQLNAIALLNRAGIYYEDVIVIDEYAMNFIIELTNADPMLPPDPVTESTFIKPWESPQPALEMQRNILKTLCSSPQNFLKYDNFIHVFELYPEKLRTTLTIEEMVRFWQDYFASTHPPVVRCSIYP